MLFGDKVVRKLISFPRPDFRRPYVSLDGRWDLYLSKGRRKWKRELDALFGRRPLSGDWRPVRVPFCLESEASGVRWDGSPVHFIYRTSFGRDVAAGRPFLRIVVGACDHDAGLYLNGIPVASGSCGYSPIEAIVSASVLLDRNELVVAGLDSRSMDLVRGKQSPFRKNLFVFYTPVTGIWQSVWLEPLGEPYLDGMRIFPLTRGAMLSLKFNGAPEDLSVTLEAGKKKLRRTLRDAEPRPDGTYLVYFDDPILGQMRWEPGRPELLPLRVTAKSGRSGDTVEGQVGLRTVSTAGGKILLNDRPLFQTLVLHQGYYPGGWYTPESPGVFTDDIALMKGCGFNGCRMHQKLEDPRFLFAADAAGFLVWGEMPSYYRGSRRALSELDGLARAACARDFNHPSLVTWVVFNESWGLYGLFARKARLAATVTRFYETMKFLDPTRPVIDNSGFHHVTGDILDLHHYLADMDRARELYGRCARREFEGFTFRRFIRLFMGMGTDVDQPLFFDRCARDEGRPLFLSEYGGYGFYRDDGRKLDELYPESLGLARESGVFEGTCYTQFTDVEQEANGLCSFERVPKIRPETLRAWHDGKRNG